MMPARSLTERDTSQTVALLMAALFMTALAYSAVLPVLPLMLAQAGLAPTAVTWHTGMLTSTYMAMVFLSAPLWGRMSDRIGRRPLIIFGLIGMAVALVSFALFRTLILAYISRAFTGVFVGAIIPVATAKVGDISAQSSRAHRFALLTSASLFGFLTGPALSGWLANASWLGREFPPSIGVYIPVIIAAAFSGLTALAVILWLPNGAKSFLSRNVYCDGVQESRINRLIPAILVLFVMFALNSFEVGMTLRGRQRLGWSPAQISMLFAECSAVMIIIQGFLFSLLVKHAPSSWLIGFGLVAMIAGLVLMPFTADYRQLLVLVIFISAGASVVVPMITYRASLGAGLAQGAALGTQTAASSLGQALGSAAVAMLFGFSVAAPFWLAAGLLMAGATLLATSNAARSSPLPTA